MDAWEDQNTNTTTPKTSGKLERE
jgi:hypothetical protein